MQCENSRALRGSKLKAHVCEFSSQSSDSREETASHFAIYYTYRTRETKKFETSHECIDAGLVNVSLTSGNSFVRVHVLFSIKQRFLFAHSSRVVLQLRLVTLLWRMGVFVFVAYLYSWSGVRVIYPNWDIGGIITGLEIESGTVRNSM